MKLSSKADGITILIRGDQNGLLNGLVTNLFHFALKSESKNYSSNRKSGDYGGEDELYDFFDFSGHDFDLLLYVCSQILMPFSYDKAILNK